MIFSRLSRVQFLFSKIQSVPGHKPPGLADNPSGRYAGSLFTAASKSNALSDVKADLQHLRQVIKASPEFRQILKNTAVRRNKQRQIFDSFATNNYSKITLNSIQAILGAGRLSQLQKIIDTYLSYCKVLNKQQDIKVISAAELNGEQKNQVKEALQKRKPDAKFKLSYEIDPSILGGLQIFAGSQFLDCSLRSRIERLKSELNRIS